jgi:poly(3-hydroxyalkanoate) synthetase
MKEILNKIEDIKTFIETSFPTVTPEWTTENEIVICNEAFILRKFSGDPSKTKTLIIPPQAGHSSHIADYDKNQSIVESTLQQRGGDVFCIEWLSCTQERKHESIRDLVSQVHECVLLIGQCHLIGLCQGGWLSAIYASIDGWRIISLTCIAAPIDFHGEGGIIYDTCTKFGIGVYRHFVTLDAGIMTGRNMLLGWKMMNYVDRFIIDYLKVFNTLGDDEKIKKIHRFRTWYENTQDLAGTWYLEAVERLFINNELIKETFDIGGKIIKLRNIDCPIAMIAGGSDDITLGSHLFALGKYVSTGSDKIYSQVIEKTGHIGVFISSKSQPIIKESIRFIDGL